MKSVLVIDDDEDICDALLNFLEDEGCKVRIATSGIQGILLAQEEVPHLILLDWQMPKMGGEQVLTELASISELKDIPVILMSANISNIPVENLKNRKHLKKPFDMNVLIDLFSS